MSANPPAAPEDHHDPLLPPEMALKAEHVGVAKATMNFWSLLALSVLAGAFIAFGALFMTVTVAGAAEVLPYGVVRLLGGLVFSLGLIMVVVGGAELFTGKNLMVMAWAGGLIKLRALMRAWTIVYIGNFAGAVGTAGLAFLSGHMDAGGGVVGRTALAIAQAKVAIPFLEAVVLGILCNVLVCLAVWLTYSARTITGKVLVIVPPVAAFVAAGFEHSIANMYFIPLGLLITWTGDAATGLSLGGLAMNLIPVTIGNMIGGGLLVGLVYWFVYLRNR